MKPEEGKPRCQKLVGKTVCGLTEKDLLHHKSVARSKGFDEEQFPDAEFHEFEAASTQPLPAPGETTRWIHEDELPKGYPYEAMYPFSRLGIDGLGGCRIFPEVKASSPSVEPAPEPLSRSVQRRVALQKGEPTPEFGPSKAELSVEMRERPKFDREELKRLMIESLKYDLIRPDNPKIWLELKDALDYAEAFGQARAASKGEELWAALRHAQSTVCFFASVIKSGERWSVTCQEALEQVQKDDKTLAALPAAPPKEAK
jgi:hypothetical protein